MLDEHINQIHLRVAFVVLNYQCSTRCWAHRYGTWMCRAFPKSNLLATANAAQTSVCAASRDGTLTSRGILDMPIDRATTFRKTFGSASARPNAINYRIGGQDLNRRRPTMRNLPVACFRLCWSPGHSESEQTSTNLVTTTP